MNQSIVLVNRSNNTMKLVHPSSPMELGAIVDSFKTTEKDTIYIYVDGVYRGEVKSR